MQVTRVEKKVDAYATRYVYDGPHVIAEYDGNNNLLRKYIYGPGIDQPVCMIEVADGNAAYYYHYDALGSVIALSDSTGDTVQTYEYSVFGEPAVEDANHTNPYMFAGRRYDIEIGLYYNRARYYNPFTGRFLQTDPLGYGDGMNWYSYCENNPATLSDPTGQWASYSHEWIEDGGGNWVLSILCYDDAGNLGTDFYFSSWNAVEDYLDRGGDFCDVDFNYDDFQDWYAEVSGQGPPIRGVGDPTIWDSAVGVAADALALLPSDETLYAVGDTCTMIGVTAGTAAIIVGTAGLATPALTSEGLLATGAAGGTTATAGASLIGRIGTATELQAAAAGSGLRVHHLIEQRFAQTLGQAAGQMTSVILDPRTHQMFTNAWRDAIGYSNSLNPLNTNTATAAHIFDAATRIYQNYPEFLKALGLGG